MYVREVLRRLAAVVVISTSVAACQSEARDARREVPQAPASNTAAPEPARRIDRSALLDRRRAAVRASRAIGARDSERAALNRRIPRRDPAHARLEASATFEDRLRPEHGGVR
jgi:hypothetical protein